MVVNCSFCDYTTERAYNLKRHMEINHPSDLQAPLPPKEEPAPPKETPAPAPAKRGRPRKNPPATTPTAVPTQQKEAPKPTTPETEQPTRESPYIKRMTSQQSPSNNDDDAIMVSLEDLIRQLRGIQLYKLKFIQTINSINLENQPDIYKQAVQDTKRTVLGRIVKWEDEEKEFIKENIDILLNSPYAAE